MWSSGIVIKAVDSIPSAGVLCSKPLCGYMFDSAFHLSEIEFLGKTRNFWELRGKK